MSLKAAAFLTIGAGLAASFLPTVGRAQESLGRMGTALDRIRERQQALNGVISRHNRQPGRGSALSVGLAYQELDALDKQVETLKKHQEALDRAQKRREQGRNQVVRALTVGGIAQQALAVMTGPIQSAISFETAMLGVAKQVPGARDANGELTEVYEKMAASVHKLGRELPIATNEIAEMVSAGARMDVPKEQLEGFVRLAGMMSSAFELPAGDLAEQMGKVAKVYGIPITNIGDLADSINYLDDNAISKGGDIINVLQRIGGTASMLGMSAKDAAALGSTFLTLGASAEVAATASNAVMRELSTAASQGDKFKEALGKNGLNLGMSAEDLQSEMAKNATGTIVQVLDALNKLPKEKRLEIATQLFGKEYGDDVAKLAAGSDEYKKQIKLANSAEARGSMQREHAARMQSVGAQWVVMKNQLTEISVTIGSKVLPALSGLMGMFSDLLGGVADWIKNSPMLVNGALLAAGGFMSFIVVLRLYRVVTGVATYASGSLSQSFQNIRHSMMGIPGEADKASSAMGRLGKAMRSPKGMFTIGLWGGFFYLIYRNWESILDFVKARFPEAGETLEKVGGLFLGAGDAALGMGSSLMLAMPLLAAPASALGSIGVKLQTLGSKFVSLGKLVMGHPLLLAVGLLATAAFLVYKNWEPIKAFFADLWDGIVETVGGGVDRFLGSVIWLWEEVKAGASGAFDWLMARVAGAVDFAASIGQAITGVFDTVKQAIMGAIDWVMEKIEAVREKIVGVLDGVKNAKDAVTDAVGGAVDKATGFVGRAWDGMKWLGNEAASAVGMGSGSVPAPPAAPAVPAMASARAPQTVNAQQTNTIHITQALGQDNKQLVDELMRRIKELQAVQARGANFDQAMAY